MLQFDLQFYEELTVAWVRTVKFISGALFWPTGQLVYVCDKCFHDLVAVDLSKDLIPKTYDSYHSHLYAYHVPNETKHYIINNFLPRTVNQWNNLLESIVLTPSLEIFKDGVAKLKHWSILCCYK